MVVMLQGDDTALHMAATKGHLDVVLHLLAMKARVDELDCVSSLSRLEMLIIRLQRAVAARAMHTPGGWDDWK